MGYVMPKILLLILGLAMLGFAGYRQIFAAAVSPEDQARCEQLLRSDSANTAETLALLLPKCSEPGMVAMIDARAGGDSAQATAQRIATANQSDTSAHLLDWALIGGGLVALAAAALAGRRRV